MLTISKKKSIQLGWRLYQRMGEAAWTTKSGRNYTVRMATGQDLPLLADLLTGLSADSRFLRFLSPVPAFTPERAEHIVRKLWLANSWPTQVLLATVLEEAVEKVVGLGELHINPQNAASADFALLVRDEWQGQGIGSLLLDRLTALAARRDITTLRSEIHPYNRAMRKVLSRQSLPVNFKFENGTMEVEINLAGTVEELRGIKAL